MDYGFDNELDLLNAQPIPETTILEEPPTTVDPGLLLLGGPDLSVRLASPVSPTFGQIFPISSPTRPTFNLPSAMELENGHSSAVGAIAIDIGVNPLVRLVPQVVIPPSRFKPLPYASSRSGIVYDVRMRFHTDPRPDAFDPHPETPKRISEIFEELNAAGLIQDISLPDSMDDFKLIRIHIRQADPSEIALVHSDKHVEFVQSLRDCSNEDLAELGVKYDSMYFSSLSWLCATLAAGGAIEATKAVVAGLVRNAVAIIRPPGHHAEHDEPSGFCFFNNVPIAAKVVQKEFSDLCRKVLILDWDVHHGNGVQQAFYEDPNVLYISLHVYMNATFYPNTDYGDHLHCGAGLGLGRNVNIPWITQGMTDADYIYAFQQVVIPIAIEFNPDLVMISAGFDAAVDDPLGGCFVTPAGYSHMTHMLMQLAKGKIVACLEGGYNLRSIAKSALAMTRTLMGEPPDRVTDFVPTAAAVTAVQTVIRTQSKFWKCMYPKVVELDRKHELGSRPMHDIIRKWQSMEFWEEYRMTPLYILRQKISKSFENQVLATPNYHEDRPLLLVFHDPPETEGFPHPISGKLELHNTYLTDISKTYVDWAVKNGFAVIDVNIPKHITGLEDHQDYTEADPVAVRTDFTRDVANYLWTNYIEVSDSTQIFLLGVGDAYVGLINLLSEHATAAEKIAHITAFVATQTLRAVTQPNDNTLNDIAARYYHTSSIYVANDHLVFERSKIKQRYGHVIRSSEVQLQAMLKVHWAEVTERWAEMTESWRVKQRPQGNIDGGIDTDVMDMDTASDRDSVLGESDSPTKTPRILVEDRSILTPGAALGTDTTGIDVLAAAAALASAVGRAARAGGGSKRNGSASASPRRKARSPARSPARGPARGPSMR